MSVRIVGTYDGNRRTTLVHGPSQSAVTTTAPVDIGGDGRSFSPTDLLAGSLASCVFTTLAGVAERRGLDLAGSHFHVEKVMSESPRRVGSLAVKIVLPASLDTESRTVLERAGRECPVHRSLHPDVEVQISFDYAALNVVQSGFA